MNKINKIFFWSSLMFLGWWLLMPLIRMSFNLEFATDTIKWNYRQFLFVAVPIVILSTLFGTLKSKEPSIYRLSKIIGTIVVSLGIIFMSLFTDMCVWSNKQILYRHIHDSKTQIILRDFGCGASDSSPSKKKAFRVQYFTNYFISCTEIDTAKIDINNWIINKLKHHKNVA
jgi:hypothetical protein